MRLWENYYLRQTNPNWKATSRIEERINEIILEYEMKIKQLQDTRNN